MYEISADVERNRLYLTLMDIGPGEGKLFNNDIRVEVEKLKPGFSAVSDIRNFVVNAPEEGAWADQIIQYLVKMGMKRAVRITGTSVSSQKGMEEAGYVAYMAENLEAAEKMLDQME